MSQHTAAICRHESINKVKHGMSQDDAVPNILSRLPVPPLLRFKAVSKRWRSLISSPDFISSHLRRSSDHPCLLIRRAPNLISSTPTFSFFDLESMVLHDIEAPFSYPAFPRIVGSCNGLVCLDVSPCHCTAFLLWNIATRKTRTVPQPLLKDVYSPYWMVASGFGSGGDDYKIVRIVHFEFQLTGVEVFSWRSGRWKIIEGHDQGDVLDSLAIQERQQGVFIKQQLHWIAFGTNLLMNHAFVVTFDTVSEKMFRVKTVEVPEGVCFKIANFRDSLALAVFPAMPAYPGYGRTIDRTEIWVLDDFSDHCWVKLYGIQSYAFGIGCPVGTWDQTKLMMKRVDGDYVVLSIYDPHDNSVKKMRVCDADYSCDVHVYVQSLVSVFAEDEEDDQECGWLCRSAPF